MDVDEAVQVAIQAAYKLGVLRGRLFEMEIGPTQELERKVLEMEITKAERLVESMAQEAAERGVEKEELAEVGEEGRRRNNEENPVPGDGVSKEDFEALVDKRALELVEKWNPRPVVNAEEFEGAVERRALELIDELQATEGATGGGNPVPGDGVSGDGIKRRMSQGEIASARRARAAASEAGRDLAAEARVAGTASGFRKQ